MPESPPPFPPLALANRVSSLAGHADPLGVYDILGADAKRELLELLPDDWSFAGKRVLDFGAGAGRTLRHFLPEAREAELWGADIDAPSVDWLQANLCPPLHARLNPVDPPLDEPDAAFDLIWALSVFTHLAANSLPWLAELHRLLRPGGLLVATYMGEHSSRAFVDEPWDPDRIGMNVLRADNDWEHGGPMVLMSDWWVEAHWGRGFEILARRTVHGQTWALLRRRPGSVTAADLAVLADDPREAAALRHNVTQVERNAALALGALHGHYEGSLSWRLTRPLRALRRRAGR